MGDNDRREEARRHSDRELVDLVTRLKHAVFGLDERDPNSLRGRLERIESVIEKRLDRQDTKLNRIQGAAWVAVLALVANLVAGQAQ